MKKLEDIVLKKGDIVELKNGYKFFVGEDYSGMKASCYTYDNNPIISIKRPMSFETIYEAQHEILDKINEIIDVINKGE